LLIKKPENLLYLTGSFFADPAQLLVFPAAAKREPVLFGGHLEKVAGITKKDTLQNIGKYLHRGTSLEIEDHLTVGEKRIIMRNLNGVKLLPSKHIVEQMRLIKDAGELANIKESMEICAAVLARVKRALAKRTWAEIELARFIRIEGLKLGADGISFEPIVAAGGNAAIPHHKPGNARLKPGQSIVLDFGFKVNGYCSDFTRTVFIRRIPPRLKFMYESVEAAFQAALLAAGDGVPTKIVDAAARNYLKSKKLDKYFIHGLGHGTGLEVHEAPRLSPLSQERLQNGMVFSIEPGVYIPRVGGVRIEDLVYLDEGAAKRFANASVFLKHNIIA
jgi:Xaa-Pro aminopeptidase